MLVLPLSYAERGSSENVSTPARSLLVAIPVSLGFLLPFVAANQLGLTFWQAYAAGDGARVR